MRSDACPGIVERIIVSQQWKTISGFRLPGHCEPTLWRRLMLWCDDVTKAGDAAFRPLFVPEADWRTSRFASFADAAATFKGRTPQP